MFCVITPSSCVRKGSVGIDSEREKLLFSAKPVCEPPQARTRWLDPQLKSATVREFSNRRARYCVPAFHIGQ